MSCKLFLSILELICGRLTFHNRGRRTEQAIIDRHVLGQRDMPTSPLMCPPQSAQPPTPSHFDNPLFCHPIWLASKLIKKRLHSHSRSLALPCRCCVNKELHQRGATHEGSRFHSHVWPRWLLGIATRS
jgi:hypothetical protein